jgi:hypothetical protein
MIKNVGQRSVQMPRLFRAISFLCVSVALSINVPVSAQPPAAPASPPPAAAPVASTIPVVIPAGGLSEDALGNVLTELGLKPKKEQTRYDFEFKAMVNKEEWVLSMSAVLSADGSSVWVMAWLDELPKSSSEVPRNALLRLLARNDKLGNGKFFAYIAANRRFVMQRSVTNSNMTTAAFRDVLKDLGQSVVETYPEWSVSNWNVNAADSAVQSVSGEKEKVVTPAPR